MSIESLKIATHYNVFGMIECYSTLVMVSRRYGASFILGGTGTDTVIDCFDWEEIESDDQWVFRPSGGLGGHPVDISTSAGSVLLSPRRLLGPIARLISLGNTANLEGIPKQKDESNLKPDSYNPDTPRVVVGGILGSDYFEKINRIPRLDLSDRMAPRLVLDKIKQLD